MTRARLARLRRLEARQKEDPRRVYLGCLLSYIGTAREARQTGDTAKEEEARRLRAKLEALAHEGTQ